MLNVTQTLRHFTDTNILVYEFCILEARNVDILND